MARTSKPPPSSSWAVPPVETISTPSFASPRAKSTSPRLSDTLSRARRMRTSPGALTSVPWDSIDIVHQHRSRVGGIGADLPRRNQTHRARQQLVLHTVDSLLDLSDARRIRKLERLLKHDRAAVHALVDEVHGHADHLHAVRDRLLDRAHAWEGGQQ